MGPVPSFLSTRGSFILTSFRCNFSFFVINSFSMAKLPKINLTGKEIEAFCWGLTKTDKSFSDTDLSLNQKLQKAGISKDQYLDYLANNPTIRDRAVEVAIDRYLLPSIGSIVRNIRDQAVKGKNPAAISQALTMLGSVTKLLKSKGASSQEGSKHVHLHIKSLQDKDLVSKMKEIRSRREEVISALPEDIRAEFQEGGMVSQIANSDRTILEEMRSERESKKTINNDQQETPTKEPPQGGSPQGGSPQGGSPQGKVSKKKTNQS